MPSASSASSSDKSLAVLIKKAMAKMPMSLDNKKSIDGYYKDAMEDVHYKMKAVEKAKKDAAAAEKAAEKARLAAVKAAEKAAEKARKAEEKAAKAVKGSKSKAAKKPSERKLFFDKMRPRVKEMFPNLSTAQATKKIADLWDREQGKDIYHM
jgi:peptidoglycan hydrolase CwlO-like protein